MSSISSLRVRPQAGPRHFQELRPFLKTVGPASLRFEIDPAPFRCSSSRNAAPVTVAAPEDETAVIKRSGCARVGLLGNPSDLYHGKTLAFAVGNFSASVRLRPSEELVIGAHPVHDLLRFDSIQHLANRVQREGYYGAVRLLLAVCKIFYEYCIDNDIKLGNGHFTLVYSTDIPRQVGLSGSSALICAALSCLLDFYKVRHLVKVETRPDLILKAEKELGIVAGLQDRAVQVYGGLIYMDFDKMYLDNLGHGLYTPMDINILPPLFLIYAHSASESGKVHSSVYQSWLNGDDFIISSMNEVANLASEGFKALTERNYGELAELMNRNSDLRRRVFGDDVLSSLNIKMAEVVRSVGAASNFTGSGGAVVALCPKGPKQVKLLRKACQQAGFIVERAKVVPSLLTREDIKTLLS